MSRTPTPRSRSSSTDSNTDKAKIRSQMEATEVEKPFIPAPYLLPWRIGLFLLTSTIVQNFSYDVTSLVYQGPRDFMNPTWTAGQSRQFDQLVYNMIYLGPVFGLVIDLVRVFRERYRPIIIIACLVNVVLCFLSFGSHAARWDYGRALVINWLLQVAVMFMYIPMNAVVIAYGNSAMETAAESSARIGGLMAQAMVWRTVGTVMAAIFSTYSQDAISLRYHALIAGAGSGVLVVQVVFLMKRSYFVDSRSSSLRHATPVRFYRSLVRIRNRTTSRSKEAVGSTFMFILCFTFIYFMLPDALMSTRFSFNGQMSMGFPKGLTRTYSVLAGAGTLLGAIAYAVWMYVAHMIERRRGRMIQVNPFLIVLVGCLVGCAGTFFHFIGVMGKNNHSFNYHVFLGFENVITQGCVRFAFMPSLSLAAMHAPSGYEAAAFELYSVATSGGGAVCSLVSNDMAQSMGVMTYGTFDGYWKFMLMSMFFRIFPILIAVTLPKYRDGDVEPIETIDDGDNEPFSNNKTPESHTPDEEKEQDQYEQEEEDMRRSL